MEVLLELELQKVEKINLKKFGSLPEYGARITEIYQYALTRSFESIVWSKNLYQNSFSFSFINLNQSAQKQTKPENPENQYCIQFDRTRLMHKGVMKFPTNLLYT